MDVRVAILRIPRTTFQFKCCGTGTTKTWFEMSKALNLYEPVCG